MTINTEQIERRLDAIWDIGSTEQGGVTRLAYSKEETEAIKYICNELPDDFDIHTDSIGNVFSTKNPESNRTILLGSHLDSVFNGGRLDGALGVVVALEAIETAYENGDLPIPPTLVILRAEESSRFGQWAIGSRGALGELTVEDFSATDQSNIPLWQAMQQQGFQPENLSEPTIDLDRVCAFLELHIEQGRVLDEQDIDIGVVTSIRAPVRYQVTVEGDYDHSGATPMEFRRDAITGAADMITTIESMANSAAENEDIVATVGDFQANNGAINKVCGNVSFPMDVRSKDEQFRDDFESDIMREIERISNQRELETNISQLDRSSPVNLDSDMIDELDSIASSKNISHCRLPSGGGHDAMNFQHAGIPTGMLFVPSYDGISHNPNEETKTESIQVATELLSEIVINGHW